MIEIRPCHLEECAALLAMWVRAGAMLVSKGARRISALVERHEAHAIGVWDALADRGWHRDERMMRYIKMA